MKEIVLINISGPDKPGITSAVTEILASSDVNILDIGQSVIHDFLSLGILAELPSSREKVEAAFYAEVSKRELEIKVRFEGISNTSYTHWVGQQGKPRHIITLLSRKTTASQISRLTSILYKYNLNIDNIIRLSGRVPLEEINKKSQASVEFSARGSVENLQDMRKECMELANELDVDIAYQEDNIFRRNRRLVAFDMDSTLIEMEVIDELARCAGVGDQVSAITERAMRGELDFCQSLTERVGLLKGLSESSLQEVADKLVMTEGAERLIGTLKKLGYKTAILSGGFSYFGQVLQKKLGIDYVYANQLEIIDGQLTGKVSGEIIDGNRKAALLTSIVEQEGICLDQVIAVGDGANDLPMLSIAGLGIAYRAKPVVKESAKQSLSTLGLDGILYLMGLSERETF